MLASPCCNVSAYVQVNGNCRCGKCGNVFLIKEAVMRDRVPTRRSKKVVRAEPYRGAKAGPITIPSYRWGATRLS